MTRKQTVAAVARRAIARAKVAGQETAKRFIVAADAELVKQGKAARARQRKRAVKSTLKKVVRTLAIAGTATAAVIAARAATRSLRGTAPKA